MHEIGKAFWRRLHGENSLKRRTCFRVTWGPSTALASASRTPTSLRMTAAEATEMAAPDILKSAGAITLRLVGVIAGAKVLRSIYSTAPIENGDNPAFSFYWKKNARHALLGVGMLALLYYVLEGGSVTINGFGIVAASVILALLITGETVLTHKEEALDAISSMPGPLALKVLVAIGAFLVAAALSIYYVTYALGAEW